MTYTVFVDDNFHFMDQEARTMHGAFDTAQAAILACQKIVDDCLLHLHKPDMTPTAMFEAYCGFGDDPFIIAKNAPEVAFSAWSYAEQRAAEICAPPNP
jgi:hypothetical protein